MKNLLILLFVVFVAACSTVKVEVVKRVPFPVSEYDSLPKKGSGTATVTGKAFVEYNGKIFYTLEKEFVRLNPKTSYSKQWYEVNYVNHDNIADADKRYFEYIYKTKPDSNGVFRFENIPEGTYYLSAPIYWDEETNNPDGSKTIRSLVIFICREVVVNDGQFHVYNIDNKSVEKE